MHTEMPVRQNRKPATVRPRRIASFLSVLLITGLLTVSATSAASSAWISLKATLAQHLLHQAWESSQESGNSVKPWPWADIAPVARLSVVGSERSMIVLDGSHGQALAFGPGRVNLQPRGKTSNLIAIGGHRDTHLAFLETLQAGQQFEVETLDGSITRYRLSETRVVDTSRESLLVDPSRSALMLITCFPFNATQTGGPMRYVAMAEVITEG